MVGSKINREIDSKVLEFIKEHHVMTICAANAGDIWCANAFYHYCEEESLFIIASDTTTRHMTLALNGQKEGIIAGSIVLETEAIGTIRGLQFKGVIRPVDEILSKYRLMYLKRFPYAILKGGDLWIVQMKEAKFTDNRLGFGKKLIMNFE